ncbi:MAG: hypothetical protein JO242_18185 [Streptosporangiaceae bacterium]|nr:hypothetical protein [Streptosporangiaceae bacterium]
MRLQISEEGADAERLAALASYLRMDLLQLNADDVASVRDGEPPPGTRVGGRTAASVLIVTLGQSAASLRWVLSAIKGWLRRSGAGRRQVLLELAGDALALTPASAADQERLTEVFVSRHAIPG